MTILSTAKIERPEWDEEVTPLDQGEGSLDLGLKAYPPVQDAIEKIQSVDWEMVKIRALLGVNALGAAISVIGRAVYTVGESLRKV